MSNTRTLQKIEPPGRIMDDHFKEWMSITSAPKPALLIDDSASETELIVQMSNNFNIHWEVCYDGESAIQKLTLKKYQLVVLDLKFEAPLDGVDLFRRIKKVCPLCPVLILSGHVSTEAVKQVTEIGFAMFAQKPTVFSSDFFEQLFLALNIPRVDGGGTKQYTKYCEDQNV